MSFPRSKTGWFCAVVYSALAAYLIDQAFTCRDWLCDLVELWAAIPFGLFYLALLQALEPVFLFGSIAYAPFTNWFFIAPTVIANAVIYYWLGVGIARLVAWLRGRRT